MVNKFEQRLKGRHNESRQVKTAISTARQVKSKLVAQNNRNERLTKDLYVFDIQWHKMLATAFACISMFLIGAPLGAIIKRGGIGFPVIISVLFFIIYYVISIGGEKYAKTGTVDVWIGVARICPGAVYRGTCLLVGRLIRPGDQLLFPGKE